MRQGLILNLGTTGSGSGSLFPSHRIKGCNGIPMSSPVLPNVAWHSAVSTHGLETQVLKATGPSLQTNRVNHLLQVAVRWSKSSNITARRPPKGDIPKGQGEKLQGTPKLQTLLPQHYFYNHIGWVTQQANIILWIEGACSFNTELFRVQIRFRGRKHTTST